MKKTVAILLTSGSALLAGCGGEGSEVRNSMAGTISNAPALAAYVGTWQTPCDGHERQILVVALQADGSGALELTPATETYLKAGCSGPVLATETLSAKIGAVPDGVADIVIKLSGSDAPASVRIDKLTLSIPAYTFNVAGPGVEYVIHHEQQQWCTDHESGSTCVDDDGMHKAYTIAGGMVLSNNKLYTVVWNGSDYVPDTLYVKQ